MSSLEQVDIRPLLGLKFFELCSVPWVEFSVLGSWSRRILGMGLWDCTGHLQVAWAWFSAKGFKLCVEGLLVFRGPFCIPQIRGA